MADLSRQNSITDFLKTTNTDVVSSLDADLKKLLHIAPEADREVCVCAISCSCSGHSLTCDSASSTTSAGS